MFVVYPIICFSPFVPNYQRKHEMGLICCLIVTLNLAINLFFMLKQTAFMLIQKFKLIRFKKVLQDQRYAKMACRTQIITFKRAIKISSIEYQEAGYQPIAAD